MRYIILKHQELRVLVALNTYVYLKVFKISKINLFTLFNII